MVSLFRGWNRLLFFCCFIFLLIGKQVLNSAKGRGQRWDGGDTCHLETGQGSRGSLFCVYNKGARGGWLHYCLSVVGRAGGETSAASATTWRESQSPGGLCGAACHTAVRAAPVSPPRAAFLLCLGCLISNENESATSCPQFISF